MVKKQIFFTCLAVMLFFGFADVSPAFTDFPDSDPSYDIGASRSELGKGHVKVRLHVGNDMKENGYQMLYKEYDGDGSLIRFNATNRQQVPEFHLPISSLHHYDFCIVVLDEDGEVMAHSGIESVAPAQFIHPFKAAARKGSARNGGPLEATLDIDHQSFPFINLLSEVKQNGVPFDGDPNNLPLLAKSNFSVMEDGRAQTIRDLVPPQVTQQGDAKIADIVFVHDDSGSLDDEAAQVKANIQDFVNKLASSNIDYRLALVPYGGDGYSSSFSPPGGRILHNGTLHADGNALMADIDGMQFDGSDEEAFCAMQLAVQSLFWRPSTQKVIILVTDEDNDHGCTEESQLTALLQNSNVTVYGLTDGDAEFDRIAAATGGQVFDVRADFTPILQEIGSSIAAKYIVQYETDNTTLDETPRTVDLTVRVDDGSGGTLEETVTKTYVPRPPIEITLTPETDNLSAKGQRPTSPLTVVAKITQGQSFLGGNGGSMTMDAQLYYKTSGSTAYVALPMSDLGNSLYSGTIPAEDVTPPYVQYYISASNGSVTSTMPLVDPASHPIVVSVLPNMPPEITHTSAISAWQGQNISISAQVEDVTNAVSEVILYYREIGDAIYKTLSESPNVKLAQFSATIPGTVVTGNGVEYYLHAADDFGVSSTYGTADSPIQVFVSAQIAAATQKEIGNITVYADAIVQDDPSNPNSSWTASGNVMIGTKVSGKKLLRIGTSLRMRYDTNTIEGISAGDLTALSIKRNPLQPAENIPVYRGDFKVDCSANPPVLTMNGGISKLRLIGNLTFFFPFAENTITIKDDEIVLHDVSAQIVKSISALITVGDLTLSQTGGSGDPITVNLSEIFPIKGSIWELSNLKFVIDFIKQSLTGSGELAIKGLLGDPRGGVGATFGFLYDPFAIETVGGKLAFPPAWQQALTIPTTPPSPIGVRIASGSFLVDKISSGSSGLQLTAGCGVKLVDAAQIAEAVEAVIGYTPISGDLALLIDLSGKVELSGAVKLLEHFELANGKIGIGNPTFVEGNVNIADTLIGRLYLSVGAPPGYFEMVGQSSMTFQIPSDALWIGGYKLADMKTDATLRFNASGIDMADFRTQYKLFFIEVGIRLDISEISDPNLYLTGWDKTIQVFKRRSARSGLRDFTLDQDYDQVVVKILSEANTARFTLTFPDGTVHTPEDATPTLSPDDPNAGNVGNIFFLSNMDANEAYYAINEPPQGEYLIEVTNEADIGDYDLMLLGPNNKPAITVDTPATDLRWDGVSSVEVSWTAEDIDDNADIDLYYDTDSTGNNGLLIATGMKEEDAENTYQWEIDSSVQSGSYYVYARIDDGENAPVFAYSVGKVIVENPDAPAVPSNVVATPQDGSIQVAWDANTEGNLMGYRVHLSDNPGAGSFKYDFGAGTDTSYLIEGLVNGQDYEVAVSAVSTDGLESSLSLPRQASPNGTGTGGSPDLTVDTDNSSVALKAGAEDVITIQVRIRNDGAFESYSAKVSCYYGEMSDANLIGTQMLGQIDSGDHADAEFEFDTGVLLSDPTTKNIFVKLHDVVLPELETGNNIGIIENTLPPDKPCKARFMADPASGYAPLTVNFDGSGSRGQSFEWDYGDGTAKGMGKTSAHTYTSSGTHTVTLTATDAANNCANTRTVSVTVISSEIHNQPPMADAGSNRTGYGGGKVTLDGSASSDPDPEDGVAYWWAQTAGPTVTLSDPTAVKPTFTVPNVAGTLEFELTVTDGIAEATAKVTVTVRALRDHHSADNNPRDNKINLSELLRVIQIYNIGAYHCDSGNKDGYGAGNGDRTCTPNSADYWPEDWRISLSELLRAVQTYQSAGYHADPNGEDGFSLEN